MPPPSPAPPEPRLVLPPPPPLLSPGARESEYQDTQLLLGRTPEGIAPPPVWYAIRAIVGFVALLTLAYLGGHGRVQALERRLNITHLMTTGIPFAVLGFVASLPQVGILTPGVLAGVSPLLPLGLGWIGFVIGSRFDARVLDRLPEGTGKAVFGTTAITVAIVMAGVACAIASMQPWAPNIIRDSLLLAIAGAMTGRTAPEILQALLPGQVMPERLSRIVELEPLLGIFGILMISAFYRPQGLAVAWQLPGTAWLFITLGIGTAMGVMLYAAFARMNKGPQFAAVLLGSAAFTSGMASYLRISPLSVCFITGAITFNLGGKWKEEVTEVFTHLERPVYFLFMIIAGAMWHPWEWQGWVLMVLFVATRLLAKSVSSEILGKWAVRDLKPGERHALAAVPMGALSVAIVISAQDLYSGPTVPWIVTAVIMGSLVTEVGLQIAIRRFSRAASFLANPGYGAD
ncbi:MAG: hypothetical protein M1541_12430 [Acidobacteria bacterium]|nr:hypothetical protein [Acidobacteriota bacterium]